MKRRRPLRVPPLLLLTAVLALAGARLAADAAEEAAAGLLAGWVGAARARHGPPALEEDALLAAAARDYAATLLALGGLSHRGPDGSGPLARYRARGGTSLSVGEILGAGAVLEAVGEAWLASRTHREVLLGAAWTHFGAGSAGEGRRRVWVVMFTRRGVEGLGLDPDPRGGWALSGRLRAAGEPVLLSGGRPLAPESWQPAGGAFRFRLEGADFPRYQRLGYRDPAGEVHVTDAFFPERLPQAAFPERLPPSPGQDPSTPRP